VLALLAVGVGLLVVQQRRLGELEAKIAAAASSPAPALSFGPATQQAPAPTPALSGGSAPGAAASKVVKSGLTMAQALALAASLQAPPPPVPAASVTLPEFLAQERIGPELWKKVEAVNQKANDQIHDLGRNFASGSVEESEQRLAAIETERKAAVAKLLNPEQMKAYEAMRATGNVEGTVLLADGAVKRWVFRY
jgi:hypothetical protein